MDRTYIIDLLRIQKDYDVRLHNLGTIGIEPLAPPDFQAFYMALNFIGVYQKKSQFYQDFLYNLFRIKVVAESNYRGFIKAAIASSKLSLNDIVNERVKSGKISRKKKSEKIENSDDWWYQM